ncbi:MAG: hypothetical protein WBL72_09330, partial [Thermoguttaceae bacterium]
MTKQGKERLFADLPDFRGPGRFPIAAYSEFMPAARVGWRPYDAAPPACGKGDSPHLCEAPFGPFRQMGTVPFS